MKPGNKDDFDPEKPLTGRRVARRASDIHGADEGSFMWLISFTDVMALMLTFFVLLFSMTEPEQQSWADMKGALQQEFNKFYGALNERGPLDDLSIDKIDFDKALDIYYLETLFKALARESKFLAEIEFNTQQGALIISLPQDLLFKPGQADIEEKGARALYALGGILARIRNKVEVTGHTDPTPVSGTGYSSNWALSLARAANVAGILESVGYDRNVIIRGHSKGRYEDLVSLRDNERRMALSRRVDIVILDNDGSGDKVFVDLGGK